MIGKDNKVFYFVTSFVLYSHLGCVKYKFCMVMQAVDLLTDINKLAAQARRFLKPDSKPSRASFSGPRSPASSSHPGTPPPDYGGGGGSVTSPLLSPRRSLESQPSQSRGLSRNNSTGLGSRNLAGPFGAAAVQGNGTKQRKAIKILFSFRPNSKQFMTKQTY